MSKPAAQAAIVVACIAGGVALRIHGADGFGWLIFIAFLAMLT